MTTVLTGDGIAYARLASLKGRVKLEGLGMKFRGGSATAVMRKEFGLKARAPHAEVIAAIQSKMEEMLAEAAREAQNGNN
jgi:hypothetical protein